MTTKEAKISQFQDEFRFLSNFYPSPITKNGIRYETVEHFYQAHKVIDLIEYKKIACMNTAGEAKKAGRNCTLRKDWESIKDSVMWEGLKLKFAPGTILAQMLLATEDVLLEEGNYWSDRYWGVDLKTGQGKNKLGKMLMKLRNKLRENNDSA